MRFPIAWYVALMVVSTGVLVDAQAQRPFTYMQEMEQIFRELTVLIKDPDENASSLELVRRLQGLTAAARKTMPPLVEKLPPASQPAELAAYRTLMDSLIVKEQALERALRSGRNDVARSTMRDIAALRKEGHGRFKSRITRGR